MWLAAAPRLHHRLQEPGHGGAALGGLVPRPRPLGADHHRAADLRARRRWRGSSAVPPTWSPTRARTTPRGRLLETTRRAELEAQAARGGPAHRRRRARCPPVAEQRASVLTALTRSSGRPLASTPRRAHLGRMNTPSASTVTPSASLELALGAGLDALDCGRSTPRSAGRRAACPAGSAGSGCRSCPACRRRRRPRRASGRGSARRPRRAPAPAGPRRPRRGGSPTSAPGRVAHRSTSGGAIALRRPTTALPQARLPPLA